MILTETFTLRASVRGLKQHQLHVKAAHDQHPTLVLKYWGFIRRQDSAAERVLLCRKRNRRVIY